MGSLNLLGMLNSWGPLVATLLWPGVQHVEGVWPVPGWPVTLGIRLECCSPTQTYPLPGRNDVGT